MNDMKIRDIHILSVHVYRLICMVSIQIIGVAERTPKMWLIKQNGANRIILRTLKASFCTILFDRIL